MFEILQDFEQNAGQLSPAILVIPGLIAVVTGLFVWLGGLGFRKGMVIVAGAASAGICGFFITGVNIILTLFCAVAGAVIAMIFEKIFVITLTAVLAVVLGFVVLAGLHAGNQDTGGMINQGRLQSGSGIIGIKQSLEIVNGYAADLSGRIKQTCSELPGYSWAIMAVLVIISVVAGFFVWRLTSAVCCSALGTVLVFAGMILLLLYKGALPITSIGGRQSYYGVAFMVMIAFGTIEQLLLCTGGSEKKKVKKETDKAKED